MTIFYWLIWANLRGMIFALEIFSKHPCLTFGQPPLFSFALYYCFYLVHIKSGISTWPLGDKSHLDLHFKTNWIFVYCIHHHHNPYNKLFRQINCLVWQYLDKSTLLFSSKWMITTIFCKSRGLCRRWDYRILSYWDPI